MKWGKFASSEALDFRLRAIPPEVFRFWHLCRAWATEHETDGVVPSDRWAMLAGGPGAAEALAANDLAVVVDGALHLDWSGQTTREQMQGERAGAKRRMERMRYAVTTASDGGVRELDQKRTEEIRPESPPLTSFEGGPGDTSRPPSTTAEKPPKRPRAAKPARAPEVAMPDGWPVAADLAALVAYGAQHGLDGEEVRREVEGMRQWSLANGARKRDWLAFGRGWLLRASTRPRGAHGPSRPVSVRTPDHIQRDEASYGETGEELFARKGWKMLKGGTG